MSRAWTGGIGLPAAQILIVDDSPFDRMMLRRAFTGKDKQTVTLRPQTPSDVSVSEADSAAQAVTMLDDAVYDAIFLDINMPGESGFTVLDAVRGRADGHWPLVFMLSGSQAPEDVTRAYAAQATAFLRKPGDIDEVRGLAQTCLALIRDVSLPTHSSLSVH